LLCLMQASIVGAIGYAWAFDTDPDRPALHIALLIGVLIGAALTMLWIALEEVYDWLRGDPRDDAPKDPEFASQRQFERPWKHPCPELQAPD
jgi:hypothetical protein